MHHVRGYQRVAEFLTGMRGFREAVSEAVGPIVDKARGNLVELRVGRRLNTVSTQFRGTLYCNPSVSVPDRWKVPHAATMLKGRTEGA
jgi:hypothetical protein